MLPLPFSYSSSCYHTILIYSFSYCVIVHILSLTLLHYSYTLPVPAFAILVITAREGGSGRGKTNRAISSVIFFRASIKLLRGYDSQALCVLNFARERDRLFFQPFVLTRLPPLAPALTIIMEEEGRGESNLAFSF